MSEAVTMGVGVAIGNGEGAKFAEGGALYGWLYGDYTPDMKTSEVNVAWYEHITSSQLYYEVMVAADGAITAKFKGVGINFDGQVGYYQQKSDSNGTYYARVSSANSYDVGFNQKLYYTPAAWVKKDGYIFSRISDTQYPSGGYGADGKWYERKVKITA